MLRATPQKHWQAICYRQFSTGCAFTVIDYLACAIHPEQDDRRLSRLRRSIT